MQIEAMVLRLRLRGSFEAADLGVRLCQHAWRDVYRCHALCFVPVAALLLFASPAISGWAALALWLLKPWFDRTMLFVLARATFGEPTSVAQWWAARGSVLFGQPLRTFLLQRLSLSRAFRQPAIQLEGLDGAALRTRMRQLLRGRLAAARGLTTAFSLVETAVGAGLFSLALWFAPPGPALSWWSLVASGEANWVSVVATLAFAVAVLLVEPFYVAAGFGLYLNRRVDLEAWDVEQELRFAFAR